MTNKSLAHAEHVERFVKVEEKKIVVATRDEVKEALRIRNQEDKANRNRYRDHGLWTTLDDIAGDLFNYGIDPFGMKKRAQEESFLEQNTQSVVERLQNTVPVIEAGLGVLDRRAADFVQALPPESLARKVFDIHGHNCLAEFTQMQGGGEFALLRGETIRDGSYKDVTSQHGYVVTSKGDFFKVKVQSYELRPNYMPKLTRSSEIRDVVATGKRQEGSQTIQIIGNGLGIAKEKGEATVQVRNFMNQQDFLRIRHIDTENQDDAADLLKFLKNSQRRAIMVAFDIGPKELAATGGGEMLLLRK